MELEALIKELELRISILEDENASLWGMLDELRKSDVQNFQEALQIQPRSPIPPLPVL